ncbi:MAG: mechanosensitive ion channel family protein [Planctomycetes bacterium]|nr:mechanosensitive ion channel family protein [Planctomycetota bacterium]
MGLLERTFLGNEVWRWLGGLAVLAVTLGFLFALRFLLVRRLLDWARTTATQIDDQVMGVLRRTHFLFLLAIGVWVGSRVLSLPDEADRWLQTIAIAALLLQGALWGETILGAWIESKVRKKEKDDPGAATSMGFIRWLGKVSIWSVVLLVLLDNVGFDVTGLVAGLGIGGVAVALSLQNILGDLFASLSILLDKPFAVGDFIVVGEYLGSVERIGLKTTRIRSLSGEQIIFSNTDLLGSRIRNYKRMQERRVEFAFGVTYETPHDKLAKIPRIVGEIVGSLGNARFERANFKELGDSALIFDAVYHVGSADYKLYRDTQESINLAMMRRFEEEGIAFAYPTRTLYVR